MLLGVHHIAIICSDYAVSKHFYTEILGLEVIAENFRQERNSYKLDLRLPNGNQIELFSFPDPPGRPTRPEACGLRHLAFSVASIESVCQYLESCGVDVEPVRVDEFTQCRYTFFCDPDGLPLELYQLAEIV